MKNTREFYIEIAGEQRRFRFKYLGLCWFREKNKKSLVEFFQDLEESKVDMIDMLIDVMYAGIMSDSPDLKITDVQNEFEIGLMNEWIELASAAMNASMPDAPEGKPVTRGKVKN